MFVASVLAFIAGIYTGAVHPQLLSFAFVLVSVFVSIAVLHFLLKKRPSALAAMLFLLAFFLAGMMRVAIVRLNQPQLPVAEGPSLYRGSVVGSSRTIKVIRLDGPASLSGMRAVIRSEKDAGIGDNVLISGSLRDLRITFDNPHSISWKWIKKLEGTHLEIKGEIISFTASRRSIDRWRRYLANRIDTSRALHPGIIKALAIGDTTGIDDGTRTLFLETGVSHILAISGSNLAIVTAFFFLASRLLLRRSPRMRQGGDDRRYAALATIPFAVFFMFTAGSSIPVIRATIMVCVFMTAVFLERGKHAWNTLLLSALVILLLYPHSLFCPTFQLTFTSVLFIILFSRALRIPAGRSYPPVRWLLSLTIMTIAATLGTLPVVLYHFHGINPVSIFYNLVAVPMMSLAAMPLSLLGLYMPFGEHLLRLSGCIIGFAITFLKGLNWGYIYPVIRPGLIEVLLYMLAVISLTLIKKVLVRFAFFAFVLPFAVLTVSFSLHERFYNKQLCVNYIDVGLGDAMVIEAPFGKRILIDGGGFYTGDFDTGKQIIAPILLSKKILTLDRVINTHPHEDHLGGLKHILEHFHAGVFHTPIDISLEPQYERLAPSLNKNGTPAVRLKRGDRFRFNNGLVIDVLHPPENFPINDLNEMSLVIKMTFGENSFLFTGDIGASTEELLILSGTPLRSSVMKVPHHGSRHSSSVNFIRAVTPRAAVMSVGPGIKGIPSDETIERYRAMSVPLYRTDRGGCVRICTDGKKLTLE